MKVTRLASGVDAATISEGAPQRASGTGHDPWDDYFRCPEEFAGFETTGGLSADEGYFTFGGLNCFGRVSARTPSRFIATDQPDVSAGFAWDGTRLRLPFDLSEVVTNLQQERYRQKPSGYLDRISSGRLTRAAYYFVRPLLPVRVRKHLQRLSLSGWHRIEFPLWPVDVTVDALMQSAMALVLKTRRLDRVPFIWFWPEGAPACALMTHDVEGPAGSAFCDDLMALDESFGIKSAFQVVPEDRLSDSESLLTRLRRRGFEVNLHDLNHDGQLFVDRQQFLRRAAQINKYGRDFQCRGFRSGAMYRKQAWYDALDFSYDMSVPNVAHLEPQRGGCCTVMPYFVGNVLELPLTTIQDYSLFHILGDYSTARWEQQIDIILSRNGLMSFITHPDYLAEKSARAVYVNLLAHLSRLRADRKLWIAPPADVDRWWRNRNQMRLVGHAGAWRIEGPDSGRARVAYATLEGNQVVYKLENVS